MQSFTLFEFFMIFFRIGLHLLTAKENLHRVSMTAVEYDPLRLNTFRGGAPVRLAVALPPVAGYPAPESARKSRYP